MLPSYMPHWQIQVVVGITEKKLTALVLELYLEVLLF